VVKSMLLLFSAVAMMCCAPSQALAVGASRQPQADLRLHPTNNNSPVEVALGMYITDLVAIDETRENFEVGGYLIAKWHDARLATPAGLKNPTVNDKPRRLRMEDIWTPLIEAANGISHKANSYSVEADKNGEVTVIERFDSVLSNTYALKKFPFDTQVLQIEFEPFLSSVPEIQFAAQTLPGTGFRDHGHIELASWSVEDVRYVTGSVDADGALPSSREALFQITIHRRSGFYIWKIFLPIVIMTLIPMFVFWIDPKDFDWLLKVPMTMLLAMVAFEFAIVRELPKVGYITFLDAVITTSFAFFFLAMIEITAAYLMQKGKRRPQAVRMHALGRWVYPASYFVVLLVLVVWFLV
jgi:hypothetical protein